MSAYLYSNSHIISELDSEEFFEYSNNKNLQEQTEEYKEKILTNAQNDENKNINLRKQR